MPRTISLSAKEHWGSESVERPPLVLLEVIHDGLAVPARIAAGNEDIALGGNTFQAVGIEAVLPDDSEQGVPRARLAIANVGKELMRWLEYSEGGRGSEIKLMVCSWTEDNSKNIVPTVEWETYLRVSSVHATPLRVEFELGYSDLLTQPAVRVRYDREHAPGLHQ